MFSSRVVKTKNERLKLKPVCSVCGNKKSRLISKNHKGSGLFDSLGLNTPKNRMKSALWNAFRQQIINMNARHFLDKENNDIINKFLLVGDKFMPKLHLWDPKVNKYFACGPFTKHEQRINQFMKDGKLSNIYKNELDKACFQHDTAYNKHKDLKRRTQSDIVLKNKVYKIAANPKVDGFQRALASMVYTFFNERLKEAGVNNKKLADELHKPIIKKFKSRKVYSSFKDNIWGGGGDVVGLADISLVSKFNKGMRYLLCVIDLLSRYAWAVGLKD